MALPLGPPTNQMYSYQTTRLHFDWNYHTWRNIIQYIINIHKLFSQIISSNSKPLQNCCIFDWNNHLTESLLTRLPVTCRSEVRSYTVPWLCKVTDEPENMLHIKHLERVLRKYLITYITIYHISINVLPKNDYRNFPKFNPS